MATEHPPAAVVPADGDQQNVRQPDEPASGLVPPASGLAPTLGDGTTEPYDPKVMDVEVDSYLKALSGLAPAPRSPRTPSERQGEVEMKKVEILDTDDQDTQQLKTLQKIQGLLSAQLMVSEDQLKSTVLFSRIVHGMFKQLQFGLSEVHNVLLDQPDPQIFTLHFQKFGEAFNKLSETIKDLYAQQRVSSSSTDDVQKQVLKDLSVVKEFLGHIRTNTNGVAKSAKNLEWEAQELRTGGSNQQSGQASVKGGSLLATLSVESSNQADSLLEAIGRLNSSLTEAIQCGVLPAKSHKRKFRDAETQRQEAEKQQRMEKEKQEEEEKERARIEQEQKAKEQRFAVTHPLNGAVLHLNAEEYGKFCEDLKSMKPGDFANRPAATPPFGFPPPIPPMPFFPPPPSTAGFPPPYGQPGYSSTPLTPSEKK